MKIDGRAFIVASGASGLGEGTARMLAGYGGRVVIANLQVEKGQAVASELGGGFLRCDVCSEADAEAVVTHAVSMGKLVGLVNLVGSFDMIRLAATAMSRNEPEASGERGILISTASAAAFARQIGQAAYAASKTGIAGMTLPIARDLA